MFQRQFVGKWWSVIGNAIPKMVLKALLQYKNISLSAMVSQLIKSILSSKNLSKDAHQIQECSIFFNHPMTQLTLHSNWIII